jgi:predicted nucleic acid-binding protein
LPTGSKSSLGTLAELHAGVLTARDTETRAVRMTTLDALADIQLIPVDAAAAVTWARMRVHLAETGRRVGVNDLWIAASAVAHSLPVITQDNDFDVLEGVAGLVIVRV